MTIQSYVEISNSLTKYDISKKFTKNNSYKMNDSLSLYSLDEIPQD